MIDLHTHILPGMDDGAKDVAMSLQMLRAQKAQNVDTVALTSHFYPSKESADRFLRRRAESTKVLVRAILALSEDEQKQLPELVIGAEVAWVPNLAHMEGLERMCLGKTRSMLLELPFEPWNMRMIDDIYHLYDRTGITPVIAHLDRYQKIQKKDLFREIFALGVPIQLGTDMLFGSFFQKRVILNLLRQEEGRFFLASDCHNLQDRKPNLQAAHEIVGRKLGEETAVRLRAQTEQIL